MISPAHFICHDPACNHFICIVRAHPSLFPSGPHIIIHTQSRHAECAAPPYSQQHQLKRAATGQPGAGAGAAGRRAAGAGLFVCRSCCRGPRALNVISFVGSGGTGAASCADSARKLNPVGALQEQQLHSKVDHEI